MSEAHLLSHTAAASRGQDTTAVRAATAALRELEAAAPAEVTAYDEEWYQGRPRRP